CLLRVAMVIEPSCPLRGPQGSHTPRTEITGSGHVLAVFWPEQISRPDTRYSVRAILDRIADEDRARKAKYRDRYRE
ncbi:hypothetical protein, partial [Nocardia nova]|uniref:hypothetical protein n=1 Tax=Nocardia nova TaxID=37330 RepID=UPI0025AF471B